MTDKRGETPSAIDSEFNACMFREYCRELKREAAQLREELEQYKERYGHALDDGLRKSAMYNELSEELARARDGVWVPVEVADNIGRWLSAALDDPEVCAEMKEDIEAWFSVLPSPNR